MPVWDEKTAPVAVFSRSPGEPYVAPTKRTAVYIDGYNLYYGRIRGTPYKWLDVVSLFGSIIRIQDPDSSVKAVKFFTAPALAKFATNGNASVEAQQAYHRAMLRCYPETFSIICGSHICEKGGTLLPVFRPGVPHNRNDRVRVWNIEEKQTDVNLAIAMYRDASKGLFDHLVVCSNDSDVKPVLAAIGEDFPDIVIGVIAPLRPAVGSVRHRAASGSLKEHADWMRLHIRDEELAAAQLPQRIETGRRPIQKPGHW